MPRFLFTLTEFQLQYLRDLADKTKVPMSEYVRQGVDSILLQHLTFSGSVSVNLSKEK